MAAHASSRAPRARGMRLALATVLGCALLLGASARVALAIDPAQMPTPALEARYLALTHQFRCPVCQNETLADSNEDVAGEVRAQIRTMLLEGKSDAQIRDYLVSRYSEFILFKPEYSLRNAWLWLSPVVLLIVGVFIAMRIIRARSALVAEDDWSGEDDAAGSSAHPR